MQDEGEPQRGQEHQQRAGRHHPGEHPPLGGVLHFRTDEVGGGARAQFRGLDRPILRLELHGAEVDGEGEEQLQNGRMLLRARPEQPYAGIDV